MLVLKSFSYLIKSLMLERVRSVASSSTTLAGRLAAKWLLGVTLCAGSSDNGLMTRQVGARVGFALRFAISSNSLRCACCSPIRVDVTRSMALLGAWDGCPASGEVASLWSEKC